MVLTKQTVAIVLTATILVLLLLLYLARKGLRQIIKNKIYQPNRRHLRLRNVAYRDLYLNVKNGKHLSLPSKAALGLDDEYINIWYLNKFKGAPIVLYFHGNQYNISYRKYMIDICNILSLNLLLVDYRGYGRSGGYPSPKNVLKDADASYRFLLSNGHKASDIIIWGESLGGSPACHAARGSGPGGTGPRNLILFSTFSSFHSLLTDEKNPVRDTAYGLLRRITEDINSYTDNLSMIRKVECPLFVFHSREDKLMNFSNAAKLVAASPSKKKVLVEMKGDHDSPKVSTENFRSLIEFLGLENVSEKDIEDIVDIVDSLSFVASTSHERSKENDIRL